jgi:DNA-binding NarL/FixJ family response regulator
MTESAKPSTGIERDFHIADLFMPPMGEGVSGKRSRVFLCVDRPERRMTLAALLATNSELEVVGKSDAAADGMRGVVAAHPDVVVLEAVGPPIERSRVVARMREASPNSAIVAISAPDARPGGLLARALVADHYLHPDEVLEHVGEVVLEVAQARTAAQAGDSATAS